jgi:SsrA-binding protein
MKSGWFTGCFSGSDFRRAPAINSLDLLLKNRYIEHMEKKVITTNRKAFHNYEILERLEAGIVLMGYEVKSLRQGHASLGDSFVMFNKNEAFIEHMHISSYAQQSTHVQDYDPLRKRKLLMHGKQIISWFNKSTQKGLAVIPLEMYFSKKGDVKIEIALAKGKKIYDKREAIKKKDIKRQMQREG